MSDDEVETRELISFPKVTIKTVGTASKKEDSPVVPNGTPEDNIPKSASSKSLDNSGKLSQCSSGNTAVIGGITSLPDHVIDNKADLCWEDLCLDIRLGAKKVLKKPILKNLSGNARPSKVTAVIGPPGCGKTTLLNCLTGNGSQGMEGRIVVSGSIQRSSTLRSLRLLVADSDAEDTLLTEVTVDETLNCAINLKSNPGTTPQDKRNIVSDALEEAGLSECRHARIARLTKDARKRLALISELIAKPPPAILVFDNPLRDMGAASSEWFLNFLRRFANCGHTIILSAPRLSAHALRHFDRLYILNEGRCVYNGPPGELVSFLSDCGLPVPEYNNPIDHVLEALAKGDKAHRITNADPKSKLDPTDLSPPPKNHRRTPSSGSKRFFTIGEGAEIEEDGISLNDDQTRFSCVSYQTFLHVNRTYPTTRLSQFLVLVTRSTRCKWRDPMTTVHRLIAGLVSSFLLGLLYYGVRNQESQRDFLLNNNFIFFMTYIITLTAMLPTLFAVPREMSVFLREQRNSSYSTGVYLLATTVAELPFHIIIPVMTGSIVYWMTFQPPESGRFAEFLVLCVLISMVSQSLALVIALASEDTKTSMLATISILVPLHLFCGFFKPIPQIPHYLHWVSYLSFARYGYEGLLLTVYSTGERAICDLPECPPPHLAPFLPANSFTEITGSENWRNFLALSVFFILFRFMSYGALKWKLYFR